MKGRNPLVLVCIGLLVPGLAAAERRDHDAHVHGTAAMDVAVLAGEVEIALRSPAMNIVGFEYEPRTEEQRERLHEAVEGLRGGAALFSFGETACRLIAVDIRHDHDADGEHDHDGHDEASGHGHDEHADGDDHAEHEDDEGHDDEHAHADDHDDASHSEVHAHYHFACKGTLVRLKTRLFERFPRTESIRVQYLTDDSQGAQTLTADEPVLRLE